MNNEKIKAAILGYGRNGSTMHADAIEKSAEFDLTAVCDIDENARNKAHERFNCRVYENYHDMLEREELDLVIIVTRSSQHCEMVCDCLEAGKNVLVSKPWALDCGQAEKMIAAVKSSGKLLLPWLPARWGVDLLRLRELIASGIIGKVFQIKKSEFSFAVRNDWQTLKEFGGGYLLNWGPHLIDQPVHLLGQSVKSVYAEMKHLINLGNAEDMFYAVMKTEDNTVIVSEYNLCADKLPNWVVQGDRGTLFVKGNEIEIHRAILPDNPDSNSYGTAAGMEITTETIPGDRYGDTDIIYAHIASALRGNEKYSVST
ncbi:MAG: Gfo/Idh/MocA family oxidoreductase, partial [Oscillospiraceae bacterium]|nr:Gfo/Idh/MocA family oxidoreductase [Oscillospiraceae bacterium]